MSESKLDRMNNFNRKVLLDVGVFEEEEGEGHLSYMKDGQPSPVTLNKTRLSLTVQKILKEGLGEERTGFHPLAEQITEGPSPVLNAFKNYICERIKVTVRHVGLSLMELASDSKRHKGMSAKASKYLTALAGIGEVDEKTVDTMRKVFDAVSQVPEKHLITIILKAKTDDGSLRQSVVTFPIMDEADSEETETFFGVKMPRKTKDKALIVSVLEYILGDEPARKMYTSGSKNGNSPYFHSLLLSFHKLATRLNDILSVHAPKCPSFEELKFNLDWTDELDNFDDFAKVCSRAVPALPGNTGKEIEEERSAFEASASDVGADDDLPWNEPKAKLSIGSDDEKRPAAGSSFRDTVNSSRSSRDRDDDRSDSRSNHGSFRDLMGGKGRDRDRDDRDSRRESPSWRSGRDRDDRDDRRGGGRGGRGW